MNELNVLLVFKREESIPGFKLFLKMYHINVIAYTTSPETAIQTYNACEVKPHVILMDANWNAPSAKSSERQPGAGLSLVKKFLQIPVPVIVMTTFHESRTLNFYREHGASGYTFRNSSETEIVDCLKNVGSGKNHFSLSKE